MARGWSRSQLADRARVSPSYVGRIERGHYERPSIQKLTAPAAALGKRVSDFAEPPAAVPPDLVEQLREIAGTDEALLRDVFADLRARPPDERAAALRFVLQALALQRASARHN